MDVMDFIVEDAARGISSLEGEMASGPEGGGQAQTSPLQAEHQLAEMQAARGHVGVGFGRFAR